MNSRLRGGAAPANHVQSLRDTASRDAERNGHA